jgi:hypothetical protein
MTDLRTRFQTLDELRAPELWHEAESRAAAAQQRSVRVQPWVFVALVLLLALVVGAVALIGARMVRLPMSLEATSMPTNTSISATPSPGPTVATAPTWTATGSMIETRSRYTATLLANGKVLVAGGAEYGTGTIKASAELYDEASGIWTATGDMVTGHYGHAAVLLPDGRVLVAGGSTAVAELYDPSSGTWTATGRMVSTWFPGFTATLLPDGKVLVAGESEGGSVDPAPPEVYDPASGTWTATRKMVTTRYGHTATLLPDGRVLVAGGGCCGKTYLASAELYDPATGRWTATGDMDVVRGGSATNGASGAHAATLLADRRVLVTGGFGQSGRGVVRASAELYDPSSGTWTFTGSMGGARLGHIAIQLADGRVLVAGGLNSAPPAEIPVTSAELYDPGTGTWSDTADALEVRAGATAMLLPDGRVLVAGGVGLNGEPLATAELYDPGSGS